MDLGYEAYTRLFPEKDVAYQFDIRYSGRFKDYNANAHRIGSRITFNLSREWLEVDETIRIGLLQHLILRILRLPHRETNETEIYQLFIKSLSLFAPVTRTDPMLEQSFTRMNEAYFDGILNKPNLVFGALATSTFGTYDYHSDTIRISAIFQDPSLRELLDYVMYHELLHKHLSFQSSKGKARYHTSAFRRLERKYPNQDAIEDKLKRIAAKYRSRKISWF